MDDRHVCIEADPYDRQKHQRSSHPDAKCVYSESDWYDGADYDTFECPNCGLRFTCEVAQ